MMHALDTVARKYNTHGIMNKWWTEASIDEYDRRAECIREHFSSFKVYDRDVSTI